MLSNITSINLDLQTQGSALVAKQVNALVSPARRIYVFGTATDVFPYFSTFANALTYANSLTPSTTNPVSIVLLSKSDNTPVTITGNDDWYALCLDGIYVSSPYREIFSTTTLPTTLPKGMRVMYEDANGVESLWVGNADGDARAVNGYPTSVSFVPTFALGDAGTITTATTAISKVFNSVVFVSWRLTISTSSPLGIWTITNIPSSIRPAAGQARMLSWRYGSDETNTPIGCLTIGDSGVATFDTDGSSIDGQTALVIYGSYAI